jgi:hypothetical protein
MVTEVARTPVEWEPIWWVGFYVSALAVHIHGGTFFWKFNLVCVKCLWDACGSCADAWAPAPVRLCGRGPCAQSLTLHLACPPHVPTLDPISPSCPQVLAVLTVAISCIYILGVSPELNFQANAPMPISNEAPHPWYYGGVTGFLTALPNAAWWYIGVECLSLASEETFEVGRSGPSIPPSRRGRLIAPIPYKAPSHECRRV